MFWCNAIHRSPCLNKKDFGKKWKNDCSIWIDGRRWKIPINICCCCLFSQDGKKNYWNKKRVAMSKTQNWTKNEKHFNKKQNRWSFKIISLCIRLLSILDKGDFSFNIWFTMEPSRMQRTNFEIFFSSFQELRKSIKWTWHAGKIYWPILGHKNKNALDNTFYTDSNRDFNILQQFEVWLIWRRTRMILYHIIECWRDFIELLLFDTQTLKLKFFDLQSQMIQYSSWLMTGVFLNNSDWILMSKRIILMVQFHFPVHPLTKQRVLLDKKMFLKKTIVNTPRMCDPYLCSTID